MTHDEFDHLLGNIDSLSRDPMRRLARVLQDRLTSAGKRSAPAQREAGETAFDVASRTGLIGCIPGAPGSPTDLSTDPKHMEGFGGG